MDAFLIIITIIIAVLLVLVNIYLLAIYCHPDDNEFGASLVCKILVVLGLTLAWAQVLLLPLDVGNTRANGGLDMITFWYAIYGAAALCITILLPFAIFYYESDEEKGMLGRLWWAFLSEICTIIIVSLILFISWAFLSVADVPITIYAQNYTHFTSSTTTLDEATIVVASSNTTMELTVSFIVYVMALMSFIGWFLFVLFGGVGLTALPMDFIEAFTTRPRLEKMKPGELVNEKKRLRAKCQELLDMGKKIESNKDNVKLASGWWSRRKANNSLSDEINKFMAGVYSLEKDYHVYKNQAEIENTNPLVFIGKLILGIVLGIVSILWLIHILLDMLIMVNGYPAHTFFNKMLIGLDDGNAGFIATAIFGALSLYLLWCCQKGNIKFGLRFFCCTIHPMKENETWMNSFMFNIILLLLCATSVTQFCSYAFSQYTRLTSIQLIFGSQVKYLRFFRWFFDYNVFVIALVIWAGLTCIYLCIRPSDKPDYLKKIDERL